MGKGKGCSWLKHWLAEVLALDGDVTDLFGTKKKKNNKSKTIESKDTINYNTLSTFQIHINGFIPFIKSAQLCDLHQ